MPVHVERKGKKYRVTEKSGKVAKNKSGTSVDGGGFKTKAKAKKQVAAINLSQRRRAGKKAPPRRRSRRKK